MEDGETPEEAVVRELAEELRINKDQVQAVVPFSIFVTVLESGGINHSESARNNQSQSVEKSQCASLLLPG